MKIAGEENLRESKALNLRKKSPVRENEGSATTYLKVCKNQRNKHNTSIK